MKTETKNKLNFFEKLTEKYNLYNNINDYLSDSEREEITDFNELNEALRDKGFFDIEVIYYYKAMEYLKENDFSLSESIDIAVEYGYELRNINSELLASLHKSRKEEETFYQLEEEVNQFLNS